MNVFKALCLSFCCIIITSCVKYDAEPFTGKTLPRTCGYSTGVTNDWIYFNLRTGERFNTLHLIRILLKENRKSAQIGISHSADIACAPTVVPVASVRVLPLIWDMEAMTNGKLFCNYPLI